MKVEIKLNKNFVTNYNKMQAEYGDEFARLNGFSDEQLSYTEFIDQHLHYHQLTHQLLFLYQ